MGELKSAPFGTLLRPCFACNMKIASLLRPLLAAAALLFLVATRVGAADSPREHLSLDANWKFHLGDDWPDALRLDKAGMSTGPASEKFNDQSWRTLNLPHDWAIELLFDKKCLRAYQLHGPMPNPSGPGYPQNSVGWYRRTFDLSAEDSGKRIWLDFDGAYRDTTVWVNGWLIGRHESGYYPFRYDITDIVRFGGKNTIAVRVDASKFEGWFYEGAGIYRHVCKRWTKTAAGGDRPGWTFCLFPASKTTCRRARRRSMWKQNLLSTHSPTLSPRW